MVIFRVTAQHWPRLSTNHKFGQINDGFVFGHWVCSFVYIQCNLLKQKLRKYWKMCHFSDLTLTFNLELDIWRSQTWLIGLLILRNIGTHAKRKLICIHVSKICPFFNAGMVYKNLRVVSMVTPLVN